MCSIVSSGPKAGRRQARAASTHHELAEALRPSARAGERGQQVGDDAHHDLRGETLWKGSWRVISSKRSMPYEYESAWLGLG